ncbi:MAG: septal ring lytic transglycosylase RlpA family protein [Bacteroidetes bacterium]|nr:septal ring lytic transglycosylase RlpA family protein [Bacteroidota bacterium]MBP7399732.1 septal ring lytic transglycosylase RlpA family protein [Chitinophagales bacterium]MBK8488145.1 septal ring lytic transglycosylase RlpA family protein [Bacteroidota bacterium]MBP9189605.1 septal ring lytic transglycosylase RlpA family protein [Chitinophagales bacterium]MBP9549053.1 septal ring lytic transglycosylase RlpA family protein [Chitinophagales bacterium]
MKITLLNKFNKWALTAATLIVLIAAPEFASAQSTETGTASYYHNKFVGRKTANGEIFVQTKLTAAHKSLPLGTWVKVTNLSNDSTVIVKINDRMPQWNKRSIDLSKTAASQLDYLHDGLTKVKIEIIPDPTAILNTFISRETTIPDYVNMVALNSLSQYGDQAMYPKMPLIQYLSFEKPKGGLFNFQR